MASGDVREGVRVIAPKLELFRPVVSGQAAFDLELRQELTRLSREMDEENGMAATIARMLRERGSQRTREQEVELWQPLA